MGWIPDLDIAGALTGRRARGLALCAVAPLLWACGGSPDPQHVVETIGSWSATLRLARTEHRTHGIGDVLARELLDRAREAATDARGSTTDAQLSATDRGRVDSALSTLDGETRRLASELRAR